MDLNKVTLIGNMVRDPESRSPATGQRVVRFTLATNYAWQDARTKAKREAIDFHDVLAWGKLAEIVQQYVKKGSKVYIEGRLRNRTYTARDGQRRVTKEIVAENMILLGYRTSAPNSGAAVNRKLVREDVDLDDSRGGREGLGLPSQRSVAPRHGCLVGAWRTTRSRSLLLRSPPPRSEGTRRFFLQESVRRCWKRVTGPQSPCKPPLSGLRPSEPWRLDCDSRPPVSRSTWSGRFTSPPALRFIR